MPQHKRVPKDPESTKGGVRGTHGHGDAPRDPVHLRPVGTQGGTASATGGSRRVETPQEREEAERAAQLELEQQDVDEEDAYVHNLATETAPGPGPNDDDAGTARVRDMDERRKRKG